MIKIITLTPDQEKARKSALDNYSKGKPYTIIAGLAGTGKSTVTKTIIDSFNIKPEQVLAGSFTGKASLRLQEQGFHDAQTLHKIFYKSHKIPGTNEFIHIPKEKSEFSQYKVILVDEISMVPNSMMKIIAKSGLFMIGLGDPFQLPPIGKDNGMLSDPDIFFDKIIRQAEDNTIIRLAHEIRNGIPVKPFSDDNVIMVPKEELTTGMLTWADQVLCGLNATRNSYNNIIRNELGFTGNQPNWGEKIIFLQNNWEFTNRDGNPLINGLIGNVTKVSKPYKDGLTQLLNQPASFANMDVQPDFGGAQYQRVKYDALPFETGDSSYIADDKANVGRNKINKIDFGYVITTHKSQGSEFDKVLGIDEPMRGCNRARWLYTMVTRASKKLVLAYDSKNKIYDLRK